MKASRQILHASKKSSLPKDATKEKREKRKQGPPQCHPKRHRPSSTRGVRRDSGGCIIVGPSATKRRLHSARTLKRNKSMQKNFCAPPTHPWHRCHSEAGGTPRQRGSKRGKGRLKETIADALGRCAPLCGRRGQQATIREREREPHPRHKVERGVHVALDVRQTTLHGAPTFGN